LSERLGGEWCWTLNLEVYGVRLWKNIRRVEGSFQVISDLRWEMAPRLDSGTNLWCGVRALKDAFPDLYDIAYANDSFVATLLKLSSGSI
jgi:hypothetical protein